MKKTIYSQHGILIRTTLKQIRDAAGLTQRELCRRLGKEHNTFISKCEMGERRIDIAEFYWICEACQVSPEKEASKLMDAFKKLK